MSDSRVDFPASEFGEHTESLLLERGPKELGPFSVCGVFGGAPAAQVWETFSHDIFAGYPSPGHYHRIAIPDYQRMRTAGQGYTASAIGPAPFFNPLAIPLSQGPATAYYRIYLRVRGVAELIPWTEDNSIMDIPLNRWLNPVGYTFRVTGNIESFIQRTFRFEKHPDSPREPIVTVPNTGILVNSTASPTPTAPLGAQYIDRLVSFSVRADRVTSLTLSVGASLWDFIEPNAGSQLYVGGSLEGDALFPQPPEALGERFATGLHVFWSQTESINPPSLIFPHLPMMLNTHVPNDQQRLEVAYAGAILEAAARREEYVDL